MHGLAISVIFSRLRRPRGAWLPSISGIRSCGRGLSSKPGGFECNRLISEVTTPIRTTSSRPFGHSGFDTTQYAYPHPHSCTELNDQILVAGSCCAICAETRYVNRSEERRVGKECRYRYDPYN